MTIKAKANQAPKRGPRLNPWGPQGVIAAHMDVMSEKRSLIDRAQHEEEQLSRTAHALCELFEDAIFGDLLDQEGFRQIPARIATRVQLANKR